LHYIDAIGELDGIHCVLEWKTTSARYPEEPARISALDPQLICYSWMTRIDEVAEVVFVRKRPDSIRRTVSSTRVANSWRRSAEMLVRRG
jgi:hypothetical protein